jgi:hypothetical protein
VENSEGVFLTKSLTEEPPPDHPSPMKHFLLAAVWLALVTTLRAEPEMFTNVYVVPPQFIELSEDRTAKTILEQAGISFLPGSSASYDMEKSQLIVRNTEEQMELVEAYVEALRSGVEKEIFVAIFEVSFQGELKELLVFCRRNG